MAVYIRVYDNLLRNQPMVVTVPPKPVLVETIAVDASSTAMPGGAAYATLTNTDLDVRLFSVGGGDDQPLLGESSETFAVAPGDVVAITAEA